MDSKRWIMSQQLQDVLFLHWTVPEDWLCGHLPPELELDLYRGEAWISAVLFKARGTHIRGMPALPGMRTFLQLNVRTYVRYGHQRGVYFFSMDSNSWAAVRAASLGGFLPYRRSHIEMAKRNEQIIFKSWHSGKATGVEGIELAYQLQEAIRKPTSLEIWLTERYSLWTKPKDRLYRLDINHPPWHLQYVKGEIKGNSLAGFLPEQLHRLRPVSHYSPSMEVLFYPPVIEETAKKR
ncbi:MAG TPA: DUF2071 domain-containing protein [Planococcus sp. (in: firmicutes)]|nr:DUF2071 domain-containing protein [Planococcus sp. (in: firmicutes)]